MTPPRNPLNEIASWVPDRQATTTGHAVAQSSRFDLAAFIQTDLKVRRGPLPWNSRGVKWGLEVRPFDSAH